MKELRVCEIRANAPVDAESLILEGRPIVFDEPTKINTPAGEFTEIIRKSALCSTDLSDVRLLYNHDLNKIPLASGLSTLFKTKIIRPTVA